MSSLFEGLEVVIDDNLPPGTALLVDRAALSRLIPSRPVFDPVAEGIGWFPPFSLYGGDILTRPKRPSLPYRVVQLALYEIVARQREDRWGRAGYAARRRHGARRLARRYYPTVDPRADAEHWVKILQAYRRYWRSMPVFIHGV